MPDDFRVKFGFFDHPKTVKLIAALGDAGVVSLWRLWAFAGQYRDQGILHGMNKSDIEIAAHWTGQPGAFVDTLVRVGYLKRKRGRTFELNDWSEHQAFLVNTPLRREKARKANLAKYGKLDKDLGSPKSKFEDSPSSSSSSISSSISSSSSTPVGVKTASQNAPKEEDEEGPPLTPEEQKRAEEFLAGIKKNGASSITNRRKKGGFESMGQIVKRATGGKDAKSKK